MKNKTKVSVKPAAALLAGLLLFTCFTAACQPTPEKPVIVNKNKDLVQEVKDQDNETGPPGKLKDLALPERYAFSSEDPGASLTISVDAGFTRPEGDKMPFARVRPMNFTQEMVTGMFNYLFPDQKPYRSNNVLTKDEITQVILTMKRELADGEFRDGEKLSDEDIANTKQQISEWEKQLETAPDEEPPLTVSDGTLQKVTETGMTDGADMKAEAADTYYELNVHLDNAYLGIHTGGKGDMFGSGNDLWYSNNDRNFSTDGMVPLSPGSTLPEAAQGKLKLPLTGAVAKADSFLSAAGIGDVRLFAAYLVDDHGTGYVDNDWSPASHYAYQLYYTRTVNGVPVSCSATEGASGDGYSPAWAYETIKFLISDDGIIEIHWMEPCEVSEVIRDDCNLIDFETAANAFEKNVKYTYGQYVNRYNDANIKITIDVSIDNIRLELVRLKGMDDPDERLYVPAYVFYGWVKDKHENLQDNFTYEGYMTSAGTGSDFYPGPIMVIAINAIDGSAIDTMADIY